MDDKSKAIFDAIGLFGLVGVAIWAGANREYLLLAALGVGTAYYLAKQKGVIR